MMHAAAARNLVTRWGSSPPRHSFSYRSLSIFARHGSDVACYQQAGAAGRGLFRGDATGCHLRRTDAPRRTTSHDSFFIPLEQQKSNSWSMPLLKNIDSVEEIIKLFDVNKDKMSEKDISVCWSRIAQIVALDRRERDYLERNQAEIENMLDYTMRNLNGFKMVPFRTSIVGIAKITKSTKKRWTAGTSAWQQFSERGLILVDDMDERGLANVVWAFATVEYESPALFGAIAKASPQKLNEFKPQNLSNTAWAYAKVGHPSPFLFDGIAKFAASQLDKFKPQELSNISLAFATMNHSSPALFDGIAKFVIPKLDKFKPQEFSNTAWAFATVGHLDPSLFDGLAKFAIPKLDKFKPQELKDIAWAFATSGHPTPALFDEVAKNAIPKLDKFNEQALSNTAWAFATVGHPGPSLFDGIAKFAIPKLHEFEPQGLKDIVWAFATVIGHPAPSLFDGLAKFAIPKLDKFEPQELSNTAWAFAKVGHSAPSLFDGITNNAIPKLEEFKPQALSTTAWACDEQNLSNTAWAYAVFEHQGPDSFVLDKDFINACNSKASLFLDEELRQLHQVGLWFHEQNSSLHFSSLLSDRCRDAFQSRQKHANKSKLQLDVTATLQEMKLHPEIEVLTSFGYSLDAVVSYNGTTVGVEVDGPSHFIGRAPNGSTILKRRQLAKLESRPLLSVPYWEWNAMQRKDLKSNTGRKWRMDYLRNALDQLVL